MLVLSETYTLTGIRTLESSPLLKLRGVAWSNGQGRSFTLQGTWDLILFNLSLFSNNLSSTRQPLNAI